jgi:uncharacterized RDD family membrane protein YckC
MFLLINTTVVFIYYFASEASTGLTAGKLITQTKVVTQDGDKPTTYNIFIRSLWRIVPLEPISWLNTTTGWHDRQSDTMVVSITATSDIE